MKKNAFAGLLALVMLMTGLSMSVPAYAASAPKATTLVSVTSAEASQIKVKWKKQSKITGYQLQCGLSKKFAEKDTVSVKVKNAKTTAKTVKKLKGGKKYYVRIRTYKTANGKNKYSKWSSVKTVTVKKSAYTASTYSEAQTSYTFRYESYLDEHFEKHKVDTATSSKEEYLIKANAVITNPYALHKKEKEDGDDIYYVVETNELVIVSTDGYIRTYFCPDDGMAYYEKQ